MIEKISFGKIYNFVNREQKKYVTPELEKHADTVDVFLYSDKKDYGTEREPNIKKCIKISVIPANLNFIQKVFTDKHFVTYHPINEEGFDQTFIKIVKSFKETFT